MALKRVWIPSPNYSSRGGAGVRLIVLHTAEGARTIESLGSFFQGDVGASSQVGADDKANTVGEYVSRANKAWTQSEFNPVATSIELCGFASWSTDEWRNHHANMLDNCAKWIAEEAAHFGVPITRLNASQAQGSGRGVCQHVDLGSRGGGHHDCGGGFPMDHVLDMARGGAGADQTTTEEDNLIASAVAANGNFHVFELDGGWIWYCWQNKGQTNWSGGEPGKGIAGMSRFAEAKDVVSISAENASDGTLHVFGRKANGSVVFTYQKPNQTAWAGGAPGKSVAGLTGFAPEPK
jgi:hypothetical protein